MKTYKLIITIIISLFIVICFSCDDNNSIPVTVSLSGNVINVASDIISSGTVSITDFDTQSLGSTDISNDGTFSLSDISILSNTSYTLNITSTNDSGESIYANMNYIYSSKSVDKLFLSRSSLNIEDELFSDEQEVVISREGYARVEGTWEMIYDGKGFKALTNEQEDRRIVFNEADGANFTITAYFMVEYLPEGEHTFDNDIGLIFHATPTEYMRFSMSPSFIRLSGCEVNSSEYGDTSVYEATMTTEGSQLNLEELFVPDKWYYLKLQTNSNTVKAYLGFADYNENGTTDIVFIIESYQFEETLVFDLINDDNFVSSSGKIGLFSDTSNGNSHFYQLNIE